MSYILVSVIILMIIGFVFSYRINHKIRMGLVDYVIFLLMDDSAREEHKRKFEEWIKRNDYPDARKFGRAAHGTVEIMAEGLAHHDSLEAAMKMIWDFKNETN